MLRIGALLLTAWLVAACATPRTDGQAGRVTVERAVELYMNNPTVAQWLRRTGAKPVYSQPDQVWRIDLKDGRILYTHYLDEEGVARVNRISPHTDDPESMRRIRLLIGEHARTIREQSAR